MSQAHIPATASVDGFVIESDSQAVPERTSAELAADMTELLSDVDAGIEPDGSEPIGATEQREPEEVETDEQKERREPGEKPEAKPDDERRPRKPSRTDELQAKINAYTRESYTAKGQAAQARQEAQAEQERLNQLRAERTAEEQRVAALRTGQAAPAKPAPPASFALPAPADDPMPDWESYDDSGKSYNEFLRDQTAWIARDVDRRVNFAVQRHTAAQQQQFKQQAEKAEEQRMFQAIDERHRQNIDQLIAEDPEFLTLARDPEFKNMPRTAFMTSLIKLHDKGPEVLRYLAGHVAEGYAFANVEITEPMREVLKTADDPVRIIDYLANNPDEADRIAHLSPSLAQRALFLVEVQQTGAKQPGSPAGARGTPARPLPARVGGARTVADSRPLDALTTDDFAEFNRRMDEAGIPA